MSKLQLPAAAPGRDALPDLTTHQIVAEAELLRRIPISRRTLFAWKSRGLLPTIRLPGSRRCLYHWPSVEAALLRMQRSGRD